jgi:uncharacterized protein YegJ (DUF2314 family)
MSVDNSEFEDDFSSIVNHILSAEPGLVDSVSAGDTKLTINADPDADWMLFEQAVRVASEDAPETPHNTRFYEDKRKAIVSL